MNKNEMARRERERLKQGPTPGNQHMRKCWTCGNVAEHEDSVTPWVRCKKCGSQDTRQVKKQ
jgi:DNA-directed RNA polymerase subunit RPC12/RpoP